MESFPDTNNKNSVGVKLKRAQPVIYEKCSCQADNFTNYAGNTMTVGPMLSYGVTAVSQVKVQQHYEF